MCAGCLKARYCSLQCQEADWNRHRDFCMKTKQKRQEKAMCKVGEKVSIVSDRVQTTRNVIRVILSEPEGQLVFLS